MKETEKKIRDLLAREEVAMAHGQGGLPLGVLAARQRLALLFDPGTFSEIDLFTTSRTNGMNVPGDGVICGHGQVGGRVVYAYAQDRTVMGGALGEMHAEKICKVADLAMKAGAPLVALLDSGGARLSENLDCLTGYGSLFLRHAMASGVIPQLSLVLGTAAGGAAFLPPMTDFVFMVAGTSRLFTRARQVLEAVEGKTVDWEELAGAHTHAASSGVAHFMAVTEEECISEARRLLGFIPSNNLEDPPYLGNGDDPARTNPELAQVVPPDPTKPYDMRRVIEGFLDNGEFFEVHRHFAANIVVGFGHLGGYSVGIIANQPRILAGCLDIDSADKAARFARFCDAFNVPLVTLVDTPGYLPGTEQEHGGIIRHGAKLLYAYAEASVPKITLVVRKAYGGAYIAMCSRSLGADRVLAWPTAEIAVMGSEGAANIIYKNEMAEAKDPEGVRQAKIQEYREVFANPYVAASRGFVDTIIHPAETRPQLFRALESIASKREARHPKKHGNFPA
ncbi:MAG: carboxyl transferase domain-containing protein [Bacillota bacterium]